LFKQLVAIIVISGVLFACNDNNKNNPSNVIAMAPGQCDIQAEKNQALWSYLNDRYLWNDDLDQTTDPASFDSLQALLDDVKSKNPLDRWSGVADSQKQDDFTSRGEEVGFGFKSFMAQSKQALLVALVYEDSDAFAAGLRRGDKILSVNDKPISEALADGSLASGNLWGPDDVGTTAYLVWRTVAGETYNGAVEKRKITINTVLHSEIIETESAKVGYFVFSSFIQPSEQNLNDVFEYFSQHNVEQLIIDLRYNGGGSSSIANQLASQIGGSNVRDKIFANYFHNANHSDKNSTELFNINGGTFAMELDKITFLTTGYTASASEMLINNLAPHIDVKLVGETTHGKPVGFSSPKLCDKQLSVVNINVTNSEGQGNFFQGLPVDCTAPDSIAGDWGDQDDPMLNEALYLIDNEQCSAVSKSLGQSHKRWLVPTGKDYFDKF
jgi:C-terminal processing protease CtpA/Prc